jgi:S1-C subfamily serine protease
MLKKTIIFITIATITSCNNFTNYKTVKNNKKTENRFIPQLEKAKKVSVFDKSFTDKVTKAISEGHFVSMEILQSQKIKNIEENSNIIIKQEQGNKMNGNQIYYYLKERSFVVGSPYLCNNCPETHLSNATAYSITDDGILLTNYHVIDKDESMATSAIFVSDAKGNIYNVIEILAASQGNDLAIIKIDTKGKKLKYIPFAKEELLGEDIYLMGHPFGQNYYMSKGIIARKYINDRDNEPRLAVTAEFGQGSSGGPFVNTKGELVAMVAGTYSNYTMNSKEHGYLQMITKEVIPVSTIWNYVKRQ